MACATYHKRLALNYHYDKNDNLDTLTYPSGNKAAYTYDSANQVIRVRLYSSGQWQTIVDSVRYAPFGPAESWLLGNGMTCSAGLDSLYRPTLISTLPDSLVSLQYGYSATSDVTQVTDQIDSSASREYTYDDSYRLIGAKSADYPDTLLRIGYLRNGNRDTLLSFTPTGVDTSVYTYTGNRLTSVNGANSLSFSYDAVGNVTRLIQGIDTTTFQYNRAGRLVSINNGAIASYSYDAWHRRVKKVVSGTDTTKYVPGADGQLLSEYHGATGWRRDYIYLDGQLIARVSSAAGERVLWVLGDHLGTPLMIVDSAKTVRWSAKRYPFGEIYSEVSSATNDVSFPGQLRDAESGLYYNWHRYYSAELGRYLQSDPVGLNGGINLYGYAGGNPLAQIDPYGLYSWGDFGYDVAQALIAIGDESSGGITTWIRSQSWYGGDSFTNKCSGAYELGVWTARGIALLLNRRTSFGFAGAPALVGQTHHAVSWKIFQSLEGHSLLGGLYRYRDTRFVTRAVNQASHIGYQRWHRELDTEIVAWIEGHPSATAEEFETLLKARYALPDLLTRFPKGI